ncbi:Retrotransposon gag domain [Arabidopsis thaliana x Arabidopsis arenosa]|uniref:Retrotransposon gag domain n=1 Tax=Arabidopsis thaliana x Arabidopsis arenosa TaxID=1240361 RepID=A0A8T2AXI3_9BRAS|nr:Retrotransposon gag domain [Arabidopsis thaliana x Arabidopsis arenosa]
MKEVNWFVAPHTGYDPIAEEELAETFTQMSLERTTPQGMKSSVLGLEAPRNQEKTLELQETYETSFTSESDQESQEQDQDTKDAEELQDTDQDTQEEIQEGPYFKKPTSKRAQDMTPEVGQRVLQEVTQRTSIGPKTHPGELPFDHIEKFEDMVSSIKAEGIPVDYLLCKLFPYSLGERGKIWLRQLRPGSLTTWQKVKDAFLIHFYDESMSEEVILDTASNGNFTTRTPSEATKLIESSASSYGIRGIDNKRRQKAIRVDFKHLEQSEVQSVRIEQPAQSTTPTPSSTCNIEAMLEAIFTRISALDSKVNNMSTQLYNTTFSNADVCADQLRSGLQQTISEMPLMTACLAVLTEHEDALVEIAPIRLEFSPVAEQVYTPQIPCPMPRRSKQGIQAKHCKGIMDKIVLGLPPVDIDKLSPPLERALILYEAPQKQNEKKKTLVVSEQVSAMIKRRFPHSLCDLGSCINLIPHSVALRLGMTDYRPTRITLLLADRSKRIPEGILADVPVQIGECLIPADFVVLAYEEEPPDPLILGRSFLATAGAQIDVKQGRISLHVFDMVMTLNMDKLRKPPTIDGQAFSVETSTDITAVYVKEFGSIEQVNMQASKLEDWSGDHLFSTWLHDEVQISDTLLQDDVFVMETQIAELSCRNSAEIRAAGLVLIDTTRVSVDTRLDETDDCRPHHLAVDTKSRHNALVSIDTTTSVNRHPRRAESELSVKAVFWAEISAASPGTIATAPLPLHPPPKQIRYSRSPPKPPDFINKTLKFSKTVLWLSKPRVFRRVLVSSFDDCAGKRSIPPIPESRPADVTYFLGQPHAPTAYTPPWMMRRFSRNPSPGLKLGRIMLKRNAREEAEEFPDLDDDDDPPPDPERRMEYIFDCYGYGESRKVALAAAQLTENALSWWDRTVAHRRRQRFDPIINWGDMKYLLWLRYVPDHYHRDLRKRFRKLSQGTRTVHEYFEEFEKLMNSLEIEESDESLMAQFIDGLQERIQRKVERAKYNGLHEFLHLAVQVEQQIRCMASLSKRSRNNTPWNTSNNQTMDKGKAVDSDSRFKNKSNEAPKTSKLEPAQLRNSSKKNQSKRRSNEGVIQFTNQVFSSLPDSDIRAFNEDFRLDQNELSYKMSCSIIMVHERSPSKWIQPKNNQGRSIFVHGKDCI